MTTYTQATRSKLYASMNVTMARLYKAKDMPSTQRASSKTMQPHESNAQAATAERERERETERERWRDMYMRIDDCRNEHDASRCVDLSHQHLPKSISQSIDGEPTAWLCGHDHFVAM